MQAVWDTIGDTTKHTMQAAWDTEKRYDKAQAAHNAAESLKAVIAKPSTVT